MGMKYAEEPFNMGMFLYQRRPSKWVHFQTHTSGHFYTGVTPPGMSLNLSTLWVTSLTLATLPEGPAAEAGPLGHRAADRAHSYCCNWGGPETEDRTGQVDRQDFTETKTSTSS